MPRLLPNAIVDYLKRDSDAKHVMSIPEIHRWNRESDMSQNRQDACTTSNKASEQRNASSQCQITNRFPQPVRQICFRRIAAIETNISAQEHPVAAMSSLAPRHGCRCADTAAYALLLMPAAQLPRENIARRVRAVRHRHAMFNSASLERE